MTKSRCDVLILGAGVIGLATAMGIKKLDPNASIIWGSISKLEKQLEELEDSIEGRASGHDKDMD